MEYGAAKINTIASVTQESKFKKGSHNTLNIEYLHYLI